MWFLRLGSALVQHHLSWEPTGFLLVLINDGEVRVKRGGLLTWERFREAATAAEQQYQHEYAKARGWRYHSTPQEHREWLWKRQALEAAQQAQYEATHPSACPWCPERYTTARGLAIHQRACHRRPEVMDTYPPPPPETYAPLRLVQGAQDA
jgi:hypothetical protein